MPLDQAERVLPRTWILHPLAATGTLARTAYRQLKPHGVPSVAATSRRSTDDRSSGRGSYRQEPRTNPCRGDRSIVPVARLDRPLDTIVSHPRKIVATGALSTAMLWPLLRHSTPGMARIGLDAAKTFPTQALRRATPHWWTIVRPPKQTRTYYTIHV